eukprot:s1488_g3.t1
MFSPSSNRSSRSSGTLAPPLEKPKRLSERSLDVQKAGVQLELAQAMEDHDVETIRRVLPVASNLGVDQKEISAAKRILSFEVQQNLLEEVDAVRNMVSELAEAVAKVEERASARNEATGPSVLQRIGPELERRVWLKLQPSIEKLLQGFISKVKVHQAPAKTGLEDFGFDDFDLNGDGYITREEFDQVRSRILKGEPLPAKVKQPEQPVPKPQEAAPKIPLAATAAAPTAVLVPVVKERSQRTPTPEDEALGRALRRSVYARAASMQKALSLGSEHYAAVRWFVKDLFKRAAVRSAEMLAQSVEEKRQAACADIASIRASKKRIEEAERKAEQQVNASTVKLQACARGKMARQQRQQLEDSTRILQRGFRRLRQRWQLGRKMDFAAVVRAVKGQRKDWTMEYHLACGSQDALGCEEFVVALQRVDVKISKTKVQKLWQGFVQQSEEPAMRLPTFWAICEAVAQGDERAAEFADMSLEEYLDGEDDGQHYSEEEVQAAQRIQAAQRGCQARHVYATQARCASEKAAAEKIQAAFQGRMVREQQAAAARIQACYQGRMVREAAAQRMPASCHGQLLYEVPVAESDLAEQEAAAEKIQAIYRGRMVREQQAAAQRMPASCHGQPLYEVPVAESDLAEKEAAAEKIQAIYRGRMVREQQARPRAAQQDRSLSGGFGRGFWKVLKGSGRFQVVREGEASETLRPRESEYSLRQSQATSYRQSQATSYRQSQASSYRPSQATSYRQSQASSYRQSQASSRASRSGELSSRRSGTPVTGLLRRIQQAAIGRVSTGSSEPEVRIKGIFGLGSSASRSSVHRPTQEWIGLCRIKDAQVVVRVAATSTSTVICTVAHGKRIMVEQAIRGGKGKIWGRISNPVAGWVLLADQQNGYKAVSKANISPSPVQEHPINRRTSRTSETPKTLSGALRSMASGQSHGSRDGAGSGASASKGSAVAGAAPSPGRATSPREA